MTTKVQNDYAGLHPGDNGPPWPTLQPAVLAYQAYYEHMPLRSVYSLRAWKAWPAAQKCASTVSTISGAWRIVMLDDRQYRSLQACNPTAAPAPAGWP